MDKPARSASRALARTAARTPARTPARPAPLSAKKAPRRPRAAPPSGDDQKKSEATRQRILDAAALVLSRDGFAGAKLVDIAAQAHVKVAALYYYYESRESLVEAVMVAGVEHVREHTMQTLASLDPATSPIDRLCAVVESHLRFVLEISNYTQAVIRNTGQVPEHIRTTLRHEIGKHGRLWQGLVDAAAEGTQFETRAQRDSLRLLILGGLNWTVEWWSETRAPLDEVVETALAMTRATLRRQRAR
jgi:AcrR family transcriptional regulator